jgi:ubiquinone/menaquinone biosynthesis C-methylase UbiE
MAALSEVTNAKVEIMAHYDKDASEFDFERSAAGYRIRHRLVKKLIIKQDRRSGFAFDIGCGTGEYTISLAEAGFDSVDGDISKGTLAIAQSKVRDHDRAGRIHLLRLESTRLPFRNDVFNMITCIAVLDCLPDKYRLLLEAHRVLRYDATFIACVDAAWSPYRFIRNVQFAFGCHRRRNANLLTA